MVDADTHPPDDQYAPLPGWLAVAVVVGTSGAVLVLEILAGRLLAPYVGVSLETYTGIIGTVLAGIAVGRMARWGCGGPDRSTATDPGAAGHRWRIGDRHGANGCARSAPPARWRTASESSCSPRSGSCRRQRCSDAVPPAVVKLQLRDLHTTGATVGRLSAYGTAGAIVATFLTGFVLVAVAAVTTIIVSVGVVLVISGLALWMALPRVTRRSARTEITSVSAFAGVALLAATALGSQCDSETTYYCVSIEPDPQRASGEVLVLDDLRHSYVDVDDPTHLGFWYTRRFAEAIEQLGPAGPVDVVHIGGGALTVPTWLQTVRPDSRQTVFEIDPELIDVVVDEFDRSIGPGTGLVAVAGDARQSLRNVADDSVDVVIGDAFGSRAVPWHLATEEFVDDVARVLRPGGVYALNVIDGGDLAFLQRRNGDDRIGAAVRRGRAELRRRLRPSGATP